MPEFAARGQEDLQQLRSGLSDTVAEAVQIIEGHYPPRDLPRMFACKAMKKCSRSRLPRSGALLTAHGQIIYITKALQKQDLGFYSHLKSATHGEKTP